MERAKALKVNAGTEPDADLGPVISKLVSTHFQIFTNSKQLILATNDAETFLTFH